MANLHLQSGEHTFDHDALFIWSPPSHGNVGQIAVDSLISTHRKRVKLIGSIESDLLMPLSGYCDITGEPTLCKPLEVYEYSRQSEEMSGEGENRKVYLLQQRAPCLKGRTARFTAELVALLTDSEASVLVVATGASAEFVVDGALQGDRMFGMHTLTASHPLGAAVGEMSSPVNQRQGRLPGGADAPQSVFDVTGGELVDSVDQHPYPHGMMVARRAVEAAAEKGLPLVCVGRYCNEGAGNIIDGRFVYEFLTKILKCK